MNGTTVVKVFAPLSAGATAVYTSSGLAYYRHADWLGSSRVASTPSRTVYYDGAYAPFGENYAETGTTDRNFTGQNQDLASDLYDFLYREYHPTQGRWIQPDPAGLNVIDATNPQTWNRYAYLANRPLEGTDPNGTCDAYNYTTVDTDGNVTFHEDVGPCPSGVLSSLIPSYFCAFFGTCGSPVSQSGAGGAGGSTAPPVAKQVVSKVCSAVPAGKVQGVSGGFGGLLGPKGSLELVTNYRTGQVSAFGSGGASLGWSGAANGSAFFGFVWGLNGNNSNYKDGFTSGSISVGTPLVHVGVQLTGSSSSGGFANGPEQMAPNYNVTSVTVGINASLISPSVIGDVSATNYSQPLQLGSGWTLGSLLDAVAVLANQLCSASGS
jgi:RHS repeat-associated protein